MSYREPIERKPRLWHVSLAMGPNFICAGERWVWANEANEAVIKARKSLDVEQGTVSWSSVVCAEDFIEREEKGPPAPKADDKPPKAT